MSETSSNISFLFNTDLLEISSAKAQVIAVQCNCQLKKRTRLNKDISKKFPFADFYSSRGECPSPGTIEVRGNNKKKERFVMALYSQKNFGDPKGNDSSTQREDWFAECLERIPRKYKKLKSIAFHRELAGGKWENYEKIICDWAEEYPKIKVMIVSRDDPRCVEDHGKSVSGTPVTTYVKDIENDSTFHAAVWLTIQECPGVNKDYIKQKAIVKMEMLKSYKPESCPLYLSLNIDPGWRDFFKDQEENLKEIQTFLVKEKDDGKTIYPPMDDVFNAFQCDPKDIRVVIIGQDPYHTEGAAMGLAFSHHPDRGVIQPSLKNIFKELKDDGFEPNNTGDLTLWAKQGVFLINTALTVEEGKAHSHRKIWNDSCFIDQVFRYLNRTCDHLVVIAWGGPAKDLSKVFTEPPHKKISSSHPSPFSCNQGFLGSSPFSKANKILEKWGKEPIDWNLS